jgi:hypothetical protein
LSARNHEIEGEPAGLAAPYGTNFTYRQQVRVIEKAVFLCSKVCQIKMHTTHPRYTPAPFHSQEYNARLPTHRDSFTKLPKTTPVTTKKKDAYANGYSMKVVPGVATFIFLTSYRCGVILGSVVVSQCRE